MNNPIRRAKKHAGKGFMKDYKIKKNLGKLCGRKLTSEMADYYKQDYDAIK